MAFSVQQQQDIIYYLGWPGKTLLTDSTHYNSVIASRLINLNDVIEAQANALVSRVKALDEILVASISRASTSEIQDIKLNPYERETLRKERSKIIRELSDLLDIDVMKSSTNMIGMIS